MFNTEVKTKFAAVIVGLSSLIGLSALAMTTSRPIGSHLLNLNEARKLAESTRSESFPVTMNQYVLEQLNRFVGTTQGREYVRNGLSRMKGYQAFIQGKLKEYDMPDELLAVPLVESDYQNLPQGQLPGNSAGLWQFIAPTAINYGLVVNQDIDERLDVDKETDAAMRLLLVNRVHFKSWPLSVIAYNAGDQLVSRGVANLKTSDPWALIENGYEGDKGYLAKVEAMILILKNPPLIE